MASIGIRTGELTGHRLWWVIEQGGEPWLCSLSHRKLWAPGETVEGDTTKVVADKGWGFPATLGGVHAFSSDAPLQEEIRWHCDYVIRMQQPGRRALMWPGADWVPIDETSTFAAGTLKMWGDVVEHENGYRSQFAKLQSIDQILGAGDLAALRAKYLPNA